jgi:hypothetical protein
MTDTTCFSFTLLSFVQAYWVLAYTELLYLPGLLHNVQNDQRGMELDGTIQSETRSAQRANANRALSRAIFLEMNLDGQ